jgi:hypothetical protein
MHRGVKVLATAQKKVRLKPWTAQDLKAIRQMVKAGTPTKAIAKTLKRSLAAVYVKASLEGISFRRKAKPAKPVRSAKPAKPAKPAKAKRK